MQFTDEGLAKRKREYYRAQTVRKEWMELKDHLPALEPGARGYEKGLPDPQWSGARERVCRSDRERHAMPDGDGVAAVCRRNAPGEELAGLGDHPGPGRLASAHHLVAEDLEDGVREITGLGVAAGRRPG